MVQNIFNSTFHIHLWLVFLVFFTFCSKVAHFVIIQNVPIQHIPKKVTTSNKMVNFGFKIALKSVTLNCLPHVETLNLHQACYRLSSPTTGNVSLIFSMCSVWNVDLYLCALYTMLDSVSTDEFILTLKRMILHTLKGPK